MGQHSTAILCLCFLALLLGNRALPSWPSSLVVHAVKEYAHYEQKLKSTAYCLWLYSQFCMMLTAIDKSEEVQGSFFA